MAEQTDSTNEITAQLQNWSENQNTATNNTLLNLVYDELHRQAHLICKKREADTRCKPPLWFTKRISNLSNKNRFRGKAVRIFSAWRRR